jgi:hypothetical protein
MLIYTDADTWRCLARCVRYIKCDTDDADSVGDASSRCHTSITTIYTAVWVLVRIVLSSRLLYVPSDAMSVLLSVFWCCRCCRCLCWYVSMRWCCSPCACKCCHRSDAILIESVSVCDADNDTVLSLSMPCCLSFLWNAVLMLMLSTMPVRSRYSLLAVSVCLSPCRSVFCLSHAVSFLMSVLLNADACWYENA